MSLKSIILEAGERYASLTNHELHREAHIFGKLYESCYIAAAKDLVKAANFIRSNDAPALKVAKALYTMVLPFSATVAENAQELRQEFANEFDNRENLVNNLRETISQLKTELNKQTEAVMEDEDETSNEVPASEAVSMAEIAAGTVKRSQAHLPFEFRRSYMK